MTDDQVRPEKSTSQEGGTNLPRSWKGSFWHVGGALALGAVPAFGIAIFVPASVSLNVLIVVGFAITAAAAICRVYAHGWRTERDGYDYAGKLLALTVVIFTGSAAFVKIPSSFGHATTLISTGLLVVIILVLIVRLARRKRTAERGK